MDNEYLNSTLLEIGEIIRGYEFDMVYILIFYKYISTVMEQHVNLVKDGNLSLVEAYEDEKNYNIIKDSALLELGYFIEFDNLFNNVLNDEDSIIHVNIKRLSNAFKQISSSPKEENIFSHIFDDINLNSPNISKLENERAKIYKKLMIIVNKFDINKNKSLTDLFEYLIYESSEKLSMSTGEFVSVNEINELISQIVTTNKKSVDSIYDPFLGLGMSLISIYNKINVSKLYGQEINSKTYNLAIMNMILHGLNYKDINICFDDAFAKPCHLDERFDIAVSQPPLGLRYPNDNLDNLERFYGFKFQKSRSDIFATLHMLYHLKDNGVMAIVLNQGILFRKPDKKIKKFLIEDKNYLDAVITLPKGLLYSTSIPVTILLFNKNKKSEEVLFIDASKEYKSQRGRNLLTNENIEKIVNTYKNKKVINKFSYLASIAEIKENDFNLTVSRYIDTFEGEFIQLNDVLDERKNLNKQYIEVNNEIELLAKKLNLNIK